MIVLYGFLPSGNVYKVRLLFAHLGIEHQSDREGSGRET
jgi:glutathione S-transferase